MVTDGIDLVIHSPADLAQMHVEYAERIKADPGIKFGVESVDRKVIPLRPGDVIAFCARPGHGKSSIAARMARMVARDIAARGKAGEEAVFFVTWEQTAEELMSYFAAGDDYTTSDYAWGRVDMEAVRRNAVASVRDPIWVIGHALRHAGRPLPRLTIDTVWEAIEGVRDRYGRKPRLIVFDYLQLIPLSRYTQSRTEQVNETVVLTKEFAIRCGAPVIANVQASRAVDQLDPPIPRMQHAQHSSAIEQHVDKFFGLWRPWRTHDHDDVIKPPGYKRGIPNSENLFILDMSKQRMEDGAHTWALWFTPEELRLTEIEFSVEPLNL